MNQLLECNNLTKQFGSLKALDQVSFSLGSGRIVGLLGPNGSGKSTLIKILNGLLVPTSGEVRINGCLPGPQTKNMISYLPEQTYLNDWMKVADIIQYFADFYDDFNKDKAYEMMARLQISATDRLKTLSKGTKEKVQLILVMSRETDLYCLDEPIGGVDPASRDYILETIISNYSDNATLLISTHLISDVEKILDDVVFLKYGQLFLSGSVEELRAQHQCSIDALFREVFKC